ncbi:MAG: ABC transporter permease [Ginsengibacter sp.]
MIKNYFKTAWRNLQRHKLFSFINIFGLALSLSVCLVVMVQINDDLSYDLFHPFPHRTYRILSDVTEIKNNKQYELASTPLPLETELKKQTEVIQDAVQVYPALKENVTFEGKKLFVNGAFTGPSFFKVFGFKLSAGNEADALALSNGIVLSSETAVKFFGKTDPIGKILDFGKSGLYQVTGVLATLPGKSHIDFDAYASSLAIDRLEKTNALPALHNNWNSLNNSYTYVVLKPDVSVKTLDNLLKQIARVPQLKSAEGTVNFTSQSILKITPGTDGIYNDIGHGTVWAKVLTIAGIGFVILLAACFNYTNLTIARALTRAKEVGVRKVAGAKRHQIFTQYIIESALIAFLALILACFALPLVRTGFHVTYQLIGFAAVFTLVTAVAAGAFPAWILSSFKPVHVLKSMSTQKLFGNLSLRKALMIFQFSISILVIIFLSVYYRQFSYLKTLDPGFASANIITLPSSANDQIFANEVSRINGVENISRQSDDFGIRGTGSLPVFLNKPVNGQGILTDFYFADAATVPVHQLKLVAGTNFPGSETFPKERYILINQQAAAAFGWKDPASAVHKVVWLNDSTSVEIRGVLKDFYDKGAARNINPLIVRNRDDGFNYLNIQVNEAGKDRVVKQIASVWKNINPHAPFEYQWLDKKIAQREDQGDVYTTMGFLALITITIASLGLLGLVIYTVETRMKEISLRKVIGANVSQLMFLLSKGFLKLLLISGLIAMPIGYVVSFIFLQNFANRVPVGLGTLMLGFMFLLAIGLITILSNTYKAAAANPAKNLRSE